MLFLATVLLALNFVTAAFLAVRTTTLWLLPNISLAAFSLLYLFPLLGTEVSETTAIAILVANLSLIVTMIGFKIRKGLRANEHANRRAGNMLVLMGVFWCLVGLAGVYASLSLAGGLFVVLENFGGRGYLDARVHGQYSGLLGIAAWTSPLGLAMVFAAWFENPKKHAYFLIFLLFFVLVVGSFFLLTVRHNAVATLLMLATVYVRYRGVNTRAILLLAASFVSVFVLFQAVRTLGLDGLSVEAVVEVTQRSSEHLEVTERMVARTDRAGHLWFSHAQDVISFFVPRAIWSDKPVTGTLNRIFFPEVAVVGSEKAAGIVGEGYVSLNHLGIVIVCVVFAGFLSVVQRKLEADRNVLRGALVAATFIPLAYIGVRNGLLGKHLISFVVIYFQCVLAVMLAGVNFRLGLRPYSDIRPLN